MKLALFDFDNTLFETPYLEINNYMESPDSLSVRKWDFKPIKKTIKKCISQCESTDTVVVLLTNRLDIVMPSLKKVLSQHSLVFDMYMPIIGKDGNRSKGLRVEELIREYPKTKMIEYWEDKDKHILDVETTLSKYPNIQLIIHKVSI
jgi:hypothetical protein